jgi:hypothetical protein
MSMLDKLKRRRVFPVQIGDETVFVSAMSKADITRLQNAADAPAELILGLSLVDEKGQPEFTLLEGESDTDFGKRIAELTADVPEITKSEIYAAVRKVSGYVTEELPKN